MPYLLTLRSSSHMLHDLNRRQSAASDGAQYRLVHYYFALLQRHFRTTISVVIVHGVVHEHQFEQQRDDW